MKKINIYLLYLVLGTLLFSCAEDDPDPTKPVISSATFDANNSLTLTQSADSVTLEFNVTSEDELRTITVGSGSSSFEIPQAAGSSNFNFTITAPKDIAGEFPLVITAVTVNGGREEATYTLIIEPATIEILLTRAGAVIEDSRFSEGTNNTYSETVSVNEPIGLNVLANAGIKSVRVNGDEKTINQPFDDDYDQIIDTSTSGTFDYEVIVEDNLGVIVTVNYEIVIE